MGSRLVLKGQAEVCVLYRGENQELAAYRTALPFSQLLDGVELPEGAETEARIQWASSEIRVLRTENGPAFGITVTVCAVLLVRRKQQVSYIEDLYSLHHAAQVRRQETPLPVAWQRDTPSQEAVQQLEFGQGRPFAYLTAAECSGVSTVQEGGRPGPAVHGAAAGAVSGRERDAGVRRAVGGGDGPGGLGAADCPGRLRPAADADHRQHLPAVGARCGSRHGGVCAGRWRR